MAIDPHKITDYSRSDAQLQDFWGFAVAVAGKKATSIARRADDFLEGCGHPGTPIERLRAMVAEGSLEQHMRWVRLGKYTLLGKSYRQLLAAVDAGLDLRTATTADLEALHGVRERTSRFFVLHTQPDARIIPVDTHQLKFLRRMRHTAPKSVPTGPRYLRLEALLLAYADACGMTPADFDLEVWTWYEAGNKTLPPFAPMRIRERRVRKAKVSAISRGARRGRTPRRPSEARLAA